MEDYLSEKEQIDAMRSWWNENWKFLVTGVVLGIGMLVGWNQYKASKINAATAASAQYAILLKAMTDGGVERAEAAAQSLYDEHPGSSYAAQARLAIAKLYMDRGADEKAAAALQALLALKGNEELRLVGRLRLARILLDQQKPQEAVDLLKPALADAAGSYAPSYQEVIGDAYFALADNARAADAYRQALLGLGDQPVIDKDLIEMKLNDVGSAGSPIDMIDTVDAAADSVSDSMSDSVEEGE